MTDDRGVLALGPARPAASSPVLLCVPGTMCSPRIFTGLTGLGRPVLAAPWLEWPGPHDMASLGAAVAGLAARHRPAVLVGHSTGGVIALSAALQGQASPGESPIAGVVVCDSGANMHGHADVDAIVGRVGSEWGPAMWTQIARRSVHRPLPEPVMTELASYPGRLSAAAVRQALCSQRDTDLLPDLPRLDGLPALVVHGRHDAARPVGHAEQLAAALPGAQLVLLDCGHTPPVEVPTVFSATVGRWLRGLARRTSQPAGSRHLPAPAPAAAGPWPSGQRLLLYTRTG